MSVTTSNLIMGPGTLYTGAFGAVEPATVVTAPTTGVWTDVGATQDGVTLKVSIDFAELEADQIIDIPGRRATKRELTVNTNLAEATLENLALTLNAPTPTTASSEKSVEADSGDASVAPTEKALLFDGLAPSGKRRRVIVRKAMSIEGVETSYKKGDQTLFPVTFSAHYVSASIKPFKFVDDISA